MTITRLKLTTLVAVLQTGLLTGCSTTELGTREDGNRTRIQITSIPSGAEVYIMGARAGVTPLQISDRDIYPVSYQTEVEKFYGRILLRKEGCKTYSTRLTRSEVRRGLVARLDCGAPLPDARPIATPSTTPIPVQKVQPKIVTPPPSLPTQQLKQLRVLQQLQEQGLISDEEEKTLRKRILNAPG